jgi:predicted aminopeptidase
VRWFLSGIFLGLAVFATSSCRTVQFYTQAVSGHTEIMAGRKPVDQVIAQPETSAALRKQLELSKRLLAFAETELKLPSGGSYKVYTDLHRPHVVWVVHAAPELSLEPKRWWYPFVGTQDYRGYFHESEATEEEALLQKQGYETSSGDVDAYSTLGVFRDPLMNTFIMRPETDLAEVLFHELSHRKFYAAGDTKFNEGMAEAVSREGVKRWCIATHRPDLLAKYEERRRRYAQAAGAINGTVARLRTVYTSDAPDEKKRTEKAEEIARLKGKLRILRGQWGGGLSSWINEPINNAKLNSFTAYEDQVPRFQKLLKDCNGDFETFWVKVRELKGK